MALLHPDCLLSTDPVVYGIVSRLMLILFTLDDKLDAAA